MTSFNRNILLESLASTLADYRQGEIDPITPKHIETWLNQFDRKDQPIILSEINTIMKKNFYLSKIKVKNYLRAFVREHITSEKNPQRALQRVHFLNIQEKGGSQKALLNLLNEVLIKDYGFGLASCGTHNADTYVYLDDAVYTGNRIRYDLTDGNDAVAWLQKGARPGSSLKIYTIAVHSSAVEYVHRYIDALARQKNVSLKWMCALQIDNCKYPEGLINFLWPQESTTSDKHIADYVSNVYEQLTRSSQSGGNLFRPANVPQSETFFSSPSARIRVESAFLRKGIDIISSCQNPKEEMRPLGYEKLKTLGFGTFFTTYRNIANNCPLVLWWGDPKGDYPLNKWYPLLPRRTNVPYNYSLNNMMFPGNLL